MDKDQLMASLLVGNEDIGGVTFDDEDRYFDWSTATDDGVVLEAGHLNGGGAVSLDLNWSEMERLQRALTLRLLQRDS